MSEGKRGAKARLTKHLCRGKESDDFQGSREQISSPLLFSSLPCDLHIKFME